MLQWQRNDDALMMSTATTSYLMGVWGMASPKMIAMYGDHGIGGLRRAKKGSKKGVFWGVLGPPWDPPGGSRGPGGARGGDFPGGAFFGVRVKIAHQHLSRLGELLNTLRNVHPRDPPRGGPPGGPPRGVLEGAL